jgi:hypothetical protein
MVSQSQHLDNYSNVTSLQINKGKTIPAAERDEVHTHTVDHEVLLTQVLK